VNVEPMKAGKYELHVDHWRKVTSRPGQPLEYEMYGRSHTDADGNPKVIVELSAEEAERLKDVISKPGERAKAEAERLRAEAERLSARAAEREAQAKDVDKDARAVGKS